MKHRFEGISIKNYRMFSAEEENYISLKPITILTGTNNSGKSSVMKFLHLISENAQKNKLEILDFNLPGEKHNLGNFENILNDKTNEFIEFCFDYTWDDIYHLRCEDDYDYYTETPFKQKIRFKQKYKKLGESGKLYFIELIQLVNKRGEKNVTKLFVYNIEEQKFFIDIEALYNYLKLQKYGKWREPYLKQELLENFDFTEIEEDLKHFDKEGVKHFIEQIVKNILLLSFVSIELNIFDKKVSYKSHLKSNYFNEMTINDFSELLQDQNPDYLKIVGSVKLSDIIDTVNFPQNYKMVLDSFVILLNDLISDLKFDHLEAAKSNSQRIYLRQGHGVSLYSLLEELRKSNILNPENEKLKFINYWLGENGFGLGENIQFNMHLHGTEIKLTKNGRITDLSDLGYGTNQILALLLKIALSEENSVLMIEEPETNIHPSLQSKLAEMFTDAYKKFGKQFIIETHSEYLIRKMQYLTAKKILKSEEDLVIHYFNTPEKADTEKRIITIHIKEDGTLTEDFGKGFFDEADNLSLDLFFLSNVKSN